MCMPSFLFVELSRHHLRNLHHGRQELIFTPAGQLPRLFQIRHNLAVDALTGITRSWLMGLGHCVSAIDATKTPRSES